MENQNNNTTQQQQQLSPLQFAESIFAECIVIAGRAENPQERMEKLNGSKEAARKYIEYNVDFWLQTRAEFENILRISEKNSWFLQSHLTASIRDRLISDHGQKATHTKVAKET